MKLKVASKKEGFRRAGRNWSEAATVVDSSEFTKDQVKVLRDEPMLIVDEVTNKEASKLESAA